jgi:copper chaperone CopZ
MPTQDDSPRAALHAPRLLATLALLGALGACSTTPEDGSGAPREIPDLPERKPAPDPPSPKTEPAAAAPAPANPYAGLPESEWPANYQTVHIKVFGMTCAIRCVREVKEMLQAVPGVLHVRIEYDEKEAIVDVTPGTDPETVLHGLKGSYTGRLL